MRNKSQTAWCPGYDLGARWPIFVWKLLLQPPRPMLAIQNPTLPCDINWDLKIVWGLKHMNLWPVKDSLARLPHYRSDHQGRNSTVIIRPFVGPTDWMINYTAPDNQHGNHFHLGLQWSSSPLYSQELWGSQRLSRYFSNCKGRNWGACNQDFWFQNSLLPLFQCHFLPLHFSNIHGVPSTCQVLV